MKIKTFIHDNYISLTIIIVGLFLMNIVSFNETLNKSYKVIITLIVSLIWLIQVVISAKYTSLPQSKMLVKECLYCGIFLLEGELLSHECAQKKEKEKQNNMKR